MKVLRPGLVVALAALFPLPAPAQRHVVVPPFAANQEGAFANRLFHVGCTSQAPERFTQVMFRTTPGMAGSVTAIGFRRRDTPGAPPTYPPVQVDVELGICHSPRKPEAPSWILAENRGTDFTIVLGRKTVNFPSVPRQSAGPYPFTHQLIFDRSFLLQANAVGLWELRLFKSSLCMENPQDLGIGFDVTHWVRDLGQSPVTDIGVPCGAVPGDNHLGVSHLSVGAAGWALKVPQSAYGPYPLPVIFGGLRADRWGSLPLPFDLGALGAPGCSLYVSLDWQWPYQWKPHDSVAAVSLDVPSDDSLLGLEVFLQGVLFGAYINRLDITTSQGVKARIGPRVVTDGATIFAPMPFSPNPLEMGQRIITLSDVFSMTVQ